MFMNEKMVVISASIQKFGFDEPTAELLIVSLGHVQNRWLHCRLLVKNEVADADANGYSHRHAATLWPE